MAGERLKGRAEGGQIQIDSGNSRILECLDSLAYCQGDLWFDILPIEMLLNFCLIFARATDQEDRAFGCCLVLYMQAALGFGIDRPGCGNDETSFHQSFGECVPGARCLVGEHQGHDTVRLQCPAAFGEDRSHPCLIIASGEYPGALLPSKFRRVGNRFVVFVGQVTSKQLGKDVSRRSA